MEIEQVKLERLKAVALMYIGAELAEDLVERPEVNVMWDYITETIALQVRMGILGREMESVECRWPADWWQAVKQRWFPKWALRRWPAQEEVRRLTARELYPKVELPDREPIIALRIE